MEQNPMNEDISQTAYSKHEEPASVHKETSEEDTHDQHVQDQQNQEAAHSRLSPRDIHEEKHSSHPTDE
jgi:hypothetical protein